MGMQSPAGSETAPEGAEERFTILFERFYRDVYGYCARRIGDAAADDAAADTFAVAWNRIDEIEWETARPWLYGVARGVLANRLRSATRYRNLMSRAVQVADPSPEAPDVQVVRRSQDREVLKAVNSLKPLDREVLLLSAWEELTAPEVAQALSISVSAAEQRLHRAKKRLAKNLKATTVIDPFPAAAEEEGSSP